MNIIPVIDLMRGEVVRGVAGRRDTYRAIQSRIAPNAMPRTVAQALVQEFGFTTGYVADLDAIAGHAPNLAAYRDIAAAGLRLLIDAGIGDIERASELARITRGERFVDGLIVGLESTPGAERLVELLQAIGSSLAIFSLDLLAGNPVTGNPVTGNPVTGNPVTGNPVTGAASWQNKSPVQIAHEAVHAGFTRLIVLDLAAVGVGQGPATLDLGQTLARDFPQCQLIGGGGVRDLADVQRFHAAGYHGVLVASALHDGRIAPADLPPP